MNASHTDTTTPGDALPGRSARPVALLAALLHLIVGVFPISVTALVAPRWFAVVAAVAWALAAVAVWRSRDTPAKALLIPVLTVAAWWLTVSAGDIILGWTA